MSLQTSAIPSLDGVRAVAVLIVFVGHGVTVPGPWPGHSGVTIFFFLSGYLITTLLRREHEARGRISLSRFYLRRALRILPPAYIAVAATTLVGLLVLEDQGISVLGVVAELLNVTNYYLIAHNGADGLPPQSSMLWSLGVEEHFYLLFPVLLIFLFRRRLTRRQIGYVLLALSAAATPLRIVLFLNDANFYHLYTASHTRYDSLMFGAAMALLFNPAMGDKPPLRLSDRAMTRLSWPAILVFILCALAPNAYKLTVADTLIYVALMPIFWAIIAHPDRGMGPLLNARPVAWIGVLSFSIYLFHRLIIAIVEQVGLPDLLTDGVALGATLAVAQIVYMTIEVPCSRLRRRLEVRVTGPAQSTTPESPCR